MRGFITNFCALMMFTHAYAQYSGIVGEVKDEEGRPLAGATLILRPGDKKALADQNGAFRFLQQPLGTYTLTAEQSGHLSKTEQFDLGSEQVFVTFILERSTQKIETVYVHDHAKTKKQEESLNIETVGQQFVLRNLGGSLMHTLERLPGVNMIGIGSGQSKPLIRGLGFNRVVVVDRGIKHEGQQWGADHGLELDQFAGGDIEIVKGAASFVYGSDAIAGAIRVLPAPIPESNGVFGDVNFIGKSNNMLYGTSIALDARRSKWSYGGRLTYQNYGDYRVPTDKVYPYKYGVELHRHQVRNTAGREFNYHLHTGYTTERFQSIVYISNVFTKSGFFANAHGLEPQRVDEAAHDASSRDIQLPHQQVRHFKAVNHSHYHLENGTVNLDLGYQHNFREEFSRYSSHGFMPPKYPEGMPYPEELEREFDKKVYSANLRSETTLGNHRLTVGTNGEHQDNGIGGRGFLVPAFRQSALGIFAYDRYRLSDHVILHAALRYDHTYLRSSAYTDWFPSKVEENGSIIDRPVVRAEALRKRYDSFVWSAGANYNLEKFNAKANIGKSFRVPIAKELAANGVNYHYFSYELGDPTLSPEESYQMDLSIGWNEERLSVQVSPFYNYFPNYIYLNPTARFDHDYGAGNQIFEYTQSRVRRYGGELQAKYRFMDHWSAEILGEYIYSEQLSGEKKGFALPFSPAPSVLTNLTWSPHLGKRMENFYLSADVRFRGRQNSVVPPEKPTPAYKTVNLQTGFRSHIGKQPVQLNLQVTNLFNVKYMDHTSFYRLIELPEMGRNVVVLVKFPLRLNAQKL